MLWWKYCSILESEFDVESFISIQLENSIEESKKVVISVTYFMFTTLSTVGLGDYHPTNSAERICCCILFLFGVLTNSYVIGSLTDIMNVVQGLNSDYEESEKLSLFLTVLKKFNLNEEMAPGRAAALERYFKYRWSNDHNHALKTREDLELFEQLPKKV
mmetsp:Transcript_2219/g.3336  ORF Transcript_2219/g.3336 Transcript_2219/m.3336 type:complete len:160 (-) Transcript_2219:2317-2796(-)